MTTYGCFQRPVAFFGIGDDLITVYSQLQHRQSSRDEQSAMTGPARLEKKHSYFHLMTRCRGTFSSSGGRGKSWTFIFGLEDILIDPSIRVALMWLCCL